ncbi:MAG: glutaminyl-peptide cyclotransferase [Vicinamibacterales bacterium]
MRCHRGHRGTKTAVGAASVGLALALSAWLFVPEAGGQVARAPAATASRAGVAGYSFDVVAQYARATDAYTQGLAFYQGRLFEGTGLYGESRLRETSLDGRQQTIVRSRPLPEGPVSDTQQGFRAKRLSSNGYSDGQIESRTFRQSVFGEGIAIKDGRIYQLTWVEGVCFVWDVSNWTTPAKTFTYSGEGWGLTHDGTNLIMSDGSDTLFFRNPATFEVVRKIQVYDPQRRSPLRLLNELEFINGQIYANIYTTRRIAIIDPKTGIVLGYVLFDGSEFPSAVSRQPTLMPPAIWAQLDSRGEVLNGIAHDPRTGRLVVTGKKWPTVFEIRLRKVTDAL